MNTRPTILVLVLAIGGLVALWLTSSSTGSQHAHALTEAVELVFSGPALPVDSIDRVTIERADQTKYEFIRTGIQWNQTVPFAHPMDAFSVRQLAMLASQLRISERLEPGSMQVALDVLGLAPADAVITFAWPNAEPVRVELGRRGVAGRAYLRINGSSSILVVNNELHDRVLDMDAKEWRVRELFPGISIDAARIERIEGANRVVLAREGRTWMMQEPAQTRTDPAAVEAFFQAAGKATASGFILDQPTDLARFGLEPPMGTLTIATASSPNSDQAGTPGGATHRLLVGARISVSSLDRFGMVEGRPTVIRIPAAALEALYMPVSSFVQPTGAGINPADVKSVSIRTAGREFRLERDVDRWIAPEFARSEVKAALVQDLLDQLTQLRAQSVQFKEYPRELEIGMITLHGFDGRAITTVRIAKEAETGRIAMENGDNVLRVFPTGLELRLDAEAYGLK